MSGRGSATTVRHSTVETELRTRHRSGNVRGDRARQRLAQDAQAPTCRCGRSVPAVDGGNRGEARLPAGDAARRAVGAGRAAAVAHDRGARQTRRAARSARPRPRLQRGCRHDLRRSHRHRRSGPGGVGAVRRPRRLLDERSPGARRTHPARARVRLRAPAGVAGTGAPRGGARSRRRRVHEGEPPVLPEQGTGGARPRLRRDRQRRSPWHRGGVRHAHQGASRHGADPDRRAAARLQPHRTAAHDRRDARTDDRPVRAACRGAGARGGRARERRGRRLGGRHGSAERRDPGDSPTTPRSTRTPTASSHADDAAQPRHPGSVRAGLDVQDRDGQRRNRGEGRQAAGPDRRECRTDPLRVARHQRRPSLRRADLRRRHRQFEQRRGDQGRTPPRAGAAGRVREPLRFWPSLLTRFPGREPGNRVESRRGSPTARSRRSRWDTRSASRRCRWPPR